MSRFTPRAKGFPVHTEKLPQTENQRKHAASVRTGGMSPKRIVPTGNYTHAGAGEILWQEMKSPADTKAPPGTAALWARLPAAPAPLNG